jgi:hypothetical protein
MLNGIAIGALVDPTVPVRRHAKVVTGEADGEKIDRGVATRCRDLVQRGVVEVDEEDIPVLVHRHGFSSAGG